MKLFRKHAPARNGNALVYSYPCLPQGPGDVRCPREERWPVSAKSYRIWRQKSINGLLSLIPRVLRMHSAPVSHLVYLHSTFLSGAPSSSLPGAAYFFFPPSVAFPTHRDFFPS
ncbi:hypothetical protein NPIL_262881 [Nephila pilipes]|uniref:Uncharacterized protein n=1 Tax=Nephila pilipes TaxID=299642 RepID=A0A8X6P6L6_NEPPI|nr:hypothetical protein NPIL_262881 [Nephila pilipes]